jgi:hypothetical protein
MDETGFMLISGIIDLKKVETLQQNLKCGIMNHSILSASAGLIPVALYAW